MLLATVACKNQSAARSDASPDSLVAQKSLTPEELGELGAKINKNPNDAQQLLSQHGLTEETFQQAVRKVAESPEDSKKYAAAYKRAS